MRTQTGRSCRTRAGRGAGATDSGADAGAGSEIGPGVVPEEVRAWGEVGVDLDPAGDPAVVVAEKDIAEEKEIGGNPHQVQTSSRAPTPSVDPAVVRQCVVGDLT